MTQVSIEMPPELKLAIEREAEEQGYTGLSEFVRDCSRRNIPRNRLQKAHEDINAGGEVESGDGDVVRAIMAEAFDRVGDPDNEYSWGGVVIPYNDIIERYEEMTGETMNNREFGHARKRFGLGKKRSSDGTVLSDSRMREKLQVLAGEHGIEWEAEVVDADD